MGVNKARMRRSRTFPSFLLLMATALAITWLPQALSAPSAGGRKRLPPRKPPPGPSFLNPANPSFEEGLKGWCQEKPVGFRHGSVEITETGVAEGKRAAVLKGVPGQSAVGLTCDPVPVPKGGVQLLLRLRYRTVGWPDVAEVRVRPLDEKGQMLLPVEDFPHTWGRLQRTEEWSEFTRACLLPPEAFAYDLTVWLRGEGALIVDAVEARVLRSEEFSVPSRAARIRGVGSDAVRVWWECPLKKVYRDAKVPDAEVDAVEISAARGEQEAFQIVLLPRSNTSAVRVRWQDLLGPSVLRREYGRAAWVDYVHVTRPRSPLARGGWTPDPLFPDDSRELKGGQAQPVWLTITVPKSVPPGLYRGAVQIEAGARDYYSYPGGASIPTLRVPVVLRVRNFTLPADSALTTLARITRCPLDGREAMRANLRAHRITGESYVGALPVRVSPEGSVSLDFRTFDAAMERYLGQGLRLFNFPGVFLGDARGFFAEDGLWNGLAPLTPEFRQAFSAYVQRVAQHLREKGWLQHAIAQLWDEPVGEARRLHHTLLAIVKAAAPDLRVCLATPADLDLLGEVDIWNVPLPDGYTSQAALRFRRPGKELWAYDNRLYSLDVDTAALDLRSYPWRLYRYGFSGAEWWSVSEWLGDPYTEPDRCGSQNGGGFLLYPPRSGVGPPVDSIRWESYREGIEDYDALVILAKAHASASSRLAVPREGFEWETLAERLTGRVVFSIADTTRDPRDLFAAREMVDRMIEMATGSPPCIARFAEERGSVFLDGLTFPGAEVRFGDVLIRADPSGRFRVPLPSEWRGRVAP